MKILRKALSLALIFICTACVLITTACSENSDISFLLLRTAYELEVGESADVEIELTQNGESLPTDDVRYASSNENIMTAENGKIIGIAEGDAVLTVTYGSMERTASVHVFERKTPNKDISIHTDRSSYDLLLDEPALDSTVVRTTVFENGIEIPDAQISYSVADPSIAEIAADGTLTAKAHGTTTLSSTHQNVTETAVVRIYASATQEQINSFDETYVNRFGRQYITNEGLHVDQVASGIELTFYGTKLTAKINSTAIIYARVFIDGDEEGTFIRMDRGTETYTLAEDLQAGIHTVRILKSSEIHDGQLVFCSFSSAQFLRAQEKSSLKIEFIGDSITTGYGTIAQGGDRTISNSDATKSYAYFAAKALDADFSCIAAQGVCVKAHQWRDYNMADDIYGYISPITKEEYDFSADADMDVVVLNLGTNDGSYITDSDASYASKFPQDYADFLNSLRDKHPNAYILCTYGLMGKNSQIDSGIRQAVQTLQDDKILYIPSTVQDNSGASGHPYYTAQERFADTIVMYVKTLLDL